MASYIHRDLYLPRGIVHICSALSSDGRCSDTQCCALHVCRSWLGANCRSTVCPLPHSLRTPENLRVLTRLGFSESNLPACDDHLRRRIAILFPQLCIHYALGQCIKSNCTELHMCKELLLRGLCSNPNCRHSHSFSLRERSILKRHLVFLPPQKLLDTIPARNLQTLLADVLCADGLYESVCSCVGGTDSTRTEPHSGLRDTSHGAHASSTDEDTQSVHSISSMAGHPNPKARIPSNPNPSLHPDGTDSSPSHSAGASAQPPSSCSTATTSTSTAYGSITCANDVVRYLLRRGGWSPWHVFAVHFQIGDDYFELQQWLESRQQVDSSFCSQKSDWIRPVLYETTDREGEVVDEVRERCSSLFDTWSISRTSSY